MHQACCLLSKRLRTGARTRFSRSEREREVFRGGVCFDSNDVCMYVRTYARCGYEVFFFFASEVCVRGVGLLSATRCRGIFIGGCGL